MVAAFTGFALIFKDLGLSQATVQQKDLTQEKVSNLFWINACFGVITMMITVCMSPLIAWFYGDIRLRNITLALSINFLFGGLTVQHQALLSRQMRFGLLSVIGFIASLLGSVIGIILAWMGFDYWSLVWKDIFISFFIASGTWVMCRWLPGLPRRGAGIRSMLKYGTDITGFNIVNYFSRNLDNILIGRFHGASSLGLYNKAYNLMYFPMTRIRFPMTKVAFPALSALQNDHERFREYYKKLNEILSFIYMPAVVYLGIYSENIIRLILGDNWIGAAVIFRILSFGAFILPIASTPDIILQTCGLTRRYFIYGTVNAFITIFSFAIGVLWGPVGVATAYVIVRYVTFFPNLWYRLRETPVSISLYFQSVYLPTISSILTGFVVILILKYVSFKSNIAELLVSFIVYAVLYFGLWWNMPHGRKKLLEYSAYPKLLFQ
jgi:PST family polysaccharide transporter